MIVTDQYYSVGYPTLNIVETEREKLGQEDQPVEGDPLHVECSRYVQVSQFGERLEKQLKVERL